jgi:hypothetical protein
MLTDPYSQRSIGPRISFKTEITNRIPGSRHLRPRDATPYFKRASRRRGSRREQPFRLAARLLSRRRRDHCAYAGEYLMLGFSGRNIGEQ